MKKKAGKAIAIIIFIAALAAVAVYRTRRQ